MVTPPMEPHSTVSFASLTHLPGGVVYSQDFTQLNKVTSSLPPPALSVCADTALYRGNSEQGGLWGKIDSPHGMLCPWFPK